MSLFSMSGSLEAARRRLGGSKEAGRRRRRPRKPSFVPRPENLENRTVLSGGYSFSTLDNPSAGTTGSSYGVQGTFSIGINDLGQISGNYGDANYVTHGFLLSNGHYTSLNDPSAGTAANPSAGFFPGTDATEINNRGQIIGFYIDANNVEHSFELSGGKFTTIDPPGAANQPGPSFTGNIDQAADINDVGQVVGGYTDAAGVTHGYLLSGGHYTTLDDPKGTFTFATGINDAGQIVGFYFDSSGAEHGFLLSRGKYTTLDDPDAGSGPNQGTLGYAINNRGQVVGWYVDAENAVHGFVLSRGQYTTLDDPDGIGATYAEGINDSGQVAGFYFDSNGLAHGFTATPSSHGSQPRDQEVKGAAHDLLHRIDIKGVVHNPGSIQAHDGPSHR
jgi:probable HAF family extracellular repeat protein